MNVDDLQEHVRGLGYVTEDLVLADTVTKFLVIRGVAALTGPNAGKAFDIGVLRNGTDPWVPQSAVHVRPNAVPMGQRASQASPLGGDWQYLSRRFDHPPSPKRYLAHIFTVLEEG